MTRNMSNPVVDRMCNNVVWMFGNLGCFLNIFMPRKVVISAAFAISECLFVCLSVHQSATLVSYVTFMKVEHAEWHAE